MADDYGYGEVDAVVKKTSSGGKYLKLELDKKYQVRIASRPRYTIRHWVNQKPQPCGGDNCAWCNDSDAEIRKKSAQWGWIVIDRADNKVKILQAPNSVAMRIRDLANLMSQKTGKPIWGDPTTWDVIIEKTQQGDAPVKYSVEGDVESREPLTEEEKQLVIESNYNLEKEMTDSKTSEHVGNYGDNATKPNMETAPEDGESIADSIPDNLGEETGSEGEDDLPF